MWFIDKQEKNGQEETTAQIEVGPSFCLFPGNRKAHSDADAERKQVHLWRWVWEKSSVLPYLRLVFQLSSFYHSSPLLDVFKVVL